MCFMTSKDWILLIVPILFNFLFTGILVAVIAKKIDIYFDRLSRKKRYSFDLLKETKLYIEKIQSQIFNLQYQMVDDYGEGFKSFFIISGDFQVFLEKNKSYMITYDRSHKNAFFRLNTLEEIIAEIIKIGLSMNNIKDASVAATFSAAVKKVQKLCMEIIDSYNLTLSKS